MVSRLYLSYLVRRRLLTRHSGRPQTPVSPCPRASMTCCTRRSSTSRTGHLRPSGPCSAGPQRSGVAAWIWAQDTTPERLVVDVGTADATVEAHLAFTGGSTTQIGYGLILRYVDPAIS